MPLNKPNIIKWEQIEKSSLYRDQVNKIYQLYRTHVEFKTDVRQSTRQFIITKVSVDSNIEQAIDEGVNYVLKEIAYLMAAPEMFKVPKVAFVYHKKWDFLQDFINGKYDAIVKKNIGYVIIA